MTAATAARPPHLWAKTPEAFATDPHLTSTMRRVYTYLDVRAGRRGYWWGGQEEIAAAVGCSVRSVKRAVAYMRDAEYLSTLRSVANETKLTYFMHARGARSPSSPDRLHQANVPSEGTRLSPPSSIRIPQTTPTATRANSTEREAAAMGTLAQPDPVRVRLDRLLSDCHIIAAAKGAAFHAQLDAWVPYLTVEVIDRVDRELAGHYWWPKAAAIIDRAVSELARGRDPWGRDARNRAPAQGAGPDTEAPRRGGMAPRSARRTHQSAPRSRPALVEPRGLRTADEINAFLDEAEARKRERDERQRRADAARAGEAERDRNAPPLW